MPDVLDAGIDVLLGKVRFLLGGGRGGGVGLGILQFFCEKSRAPPPPPPPLPGMDYCMTLQKYPHRKREKCLW